MIAAGQGGWINHPLAELRDGVGTDFIFSPQHDAVPPPVTDSRCKGCTSPL